MQKPTQRLPSPQKRLSRVELFLDYLGAQIECDYLDSLSEEELKAELDAEIEAMSPEERAEFEASVERLRERLINLLEAERRTISD